MELGQEAPHSPAHPQGLHKLPIVAGEKLSAQRVTLPFLSDPAGESGNMGPRPFPGLPPSSRQRRALSSQLLAPHAHGRACPAPCLPPLPSPALGPSHRWDHISSRRTSPCWVESCPYACVGMLEVVSELTRPTPPHPSVQPHRPFGLSGLPLPVSPPLSGSLSSLSVHLRPFWRVATPRQTSGPRSTNHAPHHGRVSGLAWVDRWVQVQLCLSLQLTRSSVDLAGPELSRRVWITVCCCPGCHSHSAVWCRCIRCYSPRWSQAESPLSGPQSPWGMTFAKSPLMWAVQGRALRTDGPRGAVSQPALPCNTPASNSGSEPQSGRCWARLPLPLSPGSRSAVSPGAAGAANHRLGACSPSPASPRCVSSTEP